MKSPKPLPRGHVLAALNAARKNGLDRILGSEPQSSPRSPLSIGVEPEL
jgi:hypothetical protein